ncbi:MAG: FAD synthetase family protein, partial [Anaerolineales bacterium]|nr:FAD synthetase family protein [Anaerolineales bacterium]
MQHVRSLEDVSIQKSWLTIGVFDGVHRGHQEIIQQLAAGAHQHGASAVVLTFYPHPGAVLGKRTGLKCLSLPDEKAALLHQYGADIIVTHPFNAQVAALDARTFIERICKYLRPEKLLIGYDFALGRDREGDAQRLRLLGETLGYSVQTFAPVRANGAVISSSRIRADIAAGDVESAAQNLGRPYSLSGPVAH